MDPGLANAEGSSLAGDVASADWVLLTGLWDGWTGPTHPSTSAPRAEPGPASSAREDSQATLYARNPTFCP